MRFFSSAFSPLVLLILLSLSLAFSRQNREEETPRQRRRQSQSVFVNTNEGGGVFFEVRFFERKRLSEKEKKNESDESRAATEK